MKSLESNPDHGMFVQQAGMALITLCTQPSVRQSLVEIGAANILVRALRIHVVDMPTTEVTPP